MNYEYYIEPIEYFTAGSRESLCDLRILFNFLVTSQIEAVPL